MTVDLVVPPSASKPRSKMFPVLVFLFVACYGLMAIVLVVQGNVIQSQRNLIAQLSQDSSQYLALKGREAAGQRAIEKKQAERLKPGQPSGQSAPRSMGKACRSCGVQMEKSQEQKNMVQEQPLQGVDKADGRRFPVKI